MSAYRRGPGCEGCRRGVRRLIAGQAACSYSWMRPPRRSVRVSCANGGARSGIALLLDRSGGRSARDRLAAEVEVDETAIGPSRPGRLGRGTFADRAIVAIAVEARPRGGCGRVRLARIADCSAATLT